MKFNKNVKHNGEFYTIGQECPQALLKEMKSQGHVGELAPAPTETVTGLAPGARGDMQDAEVTTQAAPKKKAAKKAPAAPATEAPVATETPATDAPVVDEAADETADEETDGDEAAEQFLIQTLNKGVNMYSSIDKVAAEFKQITFNSTSFVTDTDVTRYIEESDALINVYIQKRYTLPIPDTATEALKLLSLYSTLLVAERIRKILETKQATNSGANQSTRGMISTKEIMDFLKDVSNGDKDLPGLDPSSPQTPFGSGTIAGFQVDPLFKKDVRQW